MSTGSGYAPPSFAVPTTSETIPNLVTAVGNLAAVAIPTGENVMLAFKVADEAFPRMYLIIGDGDTGLWMGDGTQDPYDAGGGRISYEGDVLRLNSNAGGSILLSSDTSIGQIVDDLLFKKPTGPLLVSPDDTVYRLIIANDGTLSTEIV